MSPDHLLELAGQIAQIGAGTPRQATLNRAISTAYYALFHALCQNCVDRTVGSSFRSPRYWEIVTPIYRVVDHGAAKRIFLALVNEKSSSGLLRQIGLAFLELQTARIAADYDPGKRHTRREAFDLIGQSGGAIEALRALPADDRLLLAVKLLTRPR